jgi:3-oxoacyl-[acyl-carrier-protein] synthase II
LAGGSEATVTPLSMSLFAKIRALSTAFNDRPSSASRPFDKARDGFVMSEGSAVLILEEYEHARARNAKMYAEVVGYGLSADAYHVTQPSSDGRGAILSMKAAMKEAQLGPQHIDYINAHATSTPIGDAIEARAIANVFGDYARAHTINNDNGGMDGGVCVSSTKGSVGHMLGAAGAVEAAFTIMAIKHQCVPPNVNLDNVDDAASVLDLPRNKGRQQIVRAAMSNSFGFGGTNASLIFRQV